jgi:ABC-type polysaccharide/polyol phosphate export permease
MKALIENFSVIYKYRELIASLVAKELKARYRGSILGMAWTFINPLLLLSVYALVFSVYMRIDVPNYAVFVFAGLLPWIWFSTSLLEGVAPSPGRGR